MAELTDKQKRFCQEYIVDMNGTQAAIRAGYSEKTAKEQGSRLLSNVNVSDFIARLREKQEKRTEITADMVIRELAKVGFANIQDYISDDNIISDLSQVEGEKAAAISSVKKSITRFDGGEKEVVEFKLWNKVDALDKLGRHLGIFKEDNEQAKPDLSVNFTETVISKKI